MGYARRSAVATWALALLALSGCATPGRGGSSVDADPEPLLVLRPHWDQVCRDAPTPVLIDIDSVLPAAEPVRLWARRRLPATADAMGREASIDVAVSYHASGHLRSAYLLDHATDDALADEGSALLIRSLARRIRVIDRAHFRIRVTAGRRDPIELLPPLACMPHLYHEGADPPRVVDDARLSHAPPGRFLPPGSWIQLRLLITIRGTVDDVAVVSGDPSLRDRAARVIEALDFDPALLNGEPVERTMDLLIRFPAQAADGPAGRGPGAERVSGRERREVPPRLRVDPGPGAPRPDASP